MDGHDAHPESPPELPRSGQSRRRFLRVGFDLAVVGAGIGLAHHFGLVKKAGHWLRPSAVALQHCPDYGKGLDEALRRCWSACNPPTVKGKSLFLKVNLLEVSTPNMPVSTDSRFVAALCRLFRDLGASTVTVGDGSAFRHDTLEVAHQVGLLALLKPLAVPCLDLNYADPVFVQTAVADVAGKASLLERLVLPRSILESDLVISVAKAKTHRFTRLTCTMKNLMGAVPGSKYGWPKNVLHWNGITRTIIELAQTIKPALGIVDGVVGMEGYGPRWGRARKLGAVLMGTDLAAVDWVTARLMGMDPTKIEYLVAAEGMGYGHGLGSNVTVHGADVSRLKQVFTPAGTAPRKTIPGNKSG